jgi:hypothetical protein
VHDLWGDLVMQLAGLIPAALRDRGLVRARDLARAGFAESDSLDLTAPVPRSAAPAVRSWR